ncbi:MULTISPECIES: type ISP restriction/modification enzyme [Bacteroidales]|uniref:type ISP restriction/modification enzyme n=1 Tax=Bacteroidales TaxID=171549 RepID=UPI00130445A3|nr:MULTISPECIES: type ISP restriction/modification enzyme [Bacteroidales]
MPVEAYEYAASEKSAVEWIMEHYTVTTDRKSDITNAPNDWARKHKDEKYIFNLQPQMISVLVQTADIVKKLPKLKFKE